MSEGFFRSKKGFTVVQNEITRDTSISLKAKGLYLVIQAYITMPGKKWTKTDFVQLAKEGNKAFDGAWNELKDNGYLKVHFFPENGKWRTEYELLEEAQEGPHTFYYNKAGQLTSDNISRAQKKTDSVADAEMEEMPSKVVTSEVLETVDDRYPPFGSNGVDNFDRYPPFGSNANGTNGNGINGKGSNGDGSNANGGNNNTKDFKQSLSINTDINNGLNTLSNPIINPSVPLEKYSMEWITEYFHAQDLILTGVRESYVNLVMDILFDTLNTRKATIYVNSEQRSAEVVKSRLLKLNYLDIEYAIEQYKKQTTEIRHQKSYLLTILYEAKAQGELDITNQVQHDMYTFSGRGNGM